MPSKPCRHCRGTGYRDWCERCHNWSHPKRCGVHYRSFVNVLPCMPKKGVLSTWCNACGSFIRQHCAAQHPDKLETITTAPREGCAMTGTEVDTVF